MITGIIAAIILIAVVPPTLSKGEWGPLAVAVIIAALVVMFGAACREDAKAHSNCVSYWARGGPDAERERQRKAAYRDGAVRSEARPAVTVHTRTVTNVNVPPPQIVRVEQPRQQPIAAAPMEEMIYCGNCREIVRTTRFYAKDLNGRTVMLNRCPKCGWTRQLWA